MKPAEFARFWAKIERDQNGCWNWTAARTYKGYGAFHFRGQMSPAHRCSYEHFVGPIPDGLQLDHLCRNRACSNPDHLEPVTSAENTKRGEVGGWIGTRTHCADGHERTPENTRLHKGRHQCRACWNAYMRGYNRRRSVARRVTCDTPAGTD